MSATAVTTPGPPARETWLCDSCHTQRMTMVPHTKAAWVCPPETPLRDVAGSARPEVCAAPDRRDDRSGTINRIAQQFVISSACWRPRDLDRHASAVFDFDQLRSAPEWSAKRWKRSGQVCNQSGTDLGSIFIHLKVDLGELGRSIWGRLLSLASAQTRASNPISISWLSVRHQAATCAVPRLILAPAGCQATATTTPRPTWGRHPPRAGRVSACPPLALCDLTASRRERTLCAP